ncbi:MAG TPA: preprotein translocase subunit SecY [Candidatus Absconditabacterales bacterium]|nr:preprotein translocase subunit SecY [Candidatus Absconditabacterales bacterium]
MKFKKILSHITDIRSNKAIRKKILFTLGMLALYRLLVFVPVPFVDINKFIEILTNGGSAAAGTGLEFFSMLLGGTLDNFSIIGVGLAPYINASIIMQLLGTVIPHLEELQEQGEVGTNKIQQYTRRLSLPLAFMQSIGMVYFINSLLGGSMIDTGSFGIVLLSAFSLTVGSVIMIWIGELITEKGIANGTSLLIFASIISGLASQIYTSIAGAAGSGFEVAFVMFIIVIALVILSVFIIKTTKEIPVIYAKQGKVQQTAALPIPLNPVGMVPIIFAIAFITFPYLISQFVIKFGTPNIMVEQAAKRIELNFNIYSQQPAAPAIIVYFMLIVVFTFFYTVIVFNPDRMSDNIQKRGGFIQGIRPGTETAQYLNTIITHLCFWGGIGLGLVGIYSYVLYYLPFVDIITQSLGSLPVVVTGSGVIIIVGVIQDLINKVNSELDVQKYDKI